MAPTVYMIVTVAHGLIFRKVMQLRKIPIEPPVRTSLLMAISMGLLYANFMRAVGFTLGRNPLHEALSLPIFWFKGLFFPLILVVVVEFLRRAEIKLAEPKWARAGVWILALALSGANARVLWDISLDATPVFESLQYLPSGGQLLSWTSITVGTAALLGGLYFLRSSRQPWLALGSAVFLGTLIFSPDPWSPLAIAVGEVALMLGFTLTERSVEQMGLAMGSGELEQRLEMFSGEITDDPA